MAEAPAVIDAPPVETGLNPPPAKGSGRETLFSGLTKIAREPTPDKDVVPPAPGQKKPVAKEAPKAPVKEAPKEPAKPEEKAAEPTKADDPPKLEDESAEPQKGPKKPSDFLREELAKQKARTEALEAEVKQYKTPKEDPEKKSLTEKFAQEEKRRKELEDELRFSNYERSPEFKEKYVKPYHEAYAEAVADLKQMTVPVDLNDPTGPQRAATEQELNQLVNLPPQQAGKLAKLLFEEGAQTMINHRERILQTWRAQQKALEEGRKNGEQREKQLAELQTKQQAELRKTQMELRSSNEPDFLKRHPELTIELDAKGEPLDAEMQKLLDQDRTVTDKLFDDSTNWPPEKKLEMHAEMRNRAAHFGTVVRTLRKVVTQLDEAKKKLSEYEGSEPGKGDGNKEVPPELAGAIGMTSMLEGLKKLGRPSSGPI